ncbi:hypothetical protein ACHHYP_04246, partial [Achlya hypogyna]
MLMTHRNNGKRLDQLDRELAKADEGHEGLVVEEAVRLVTACVSSQSLVPAVHRSSWNAPLQLSASFATQPLDLNASGPKRKDNSRINGQLINAESSKELLTIFNENREHFNIVNITTLLNQLGKVHRLHATASSYDEALFREALAKCVQNTAKMDLRAMGTVLHALAKMSRRDDAGFLDAVLIRVRSSDVLTGAAPIAVSNVVWGAEKLGCRDRSFYHQIARHVRQLNVAQRAEYSPIALANISMAFAKAGMSDAPGSLYETVERVVKSRDLATFEPQHVANILWSFASVQRFESPLFSLVEAHLESRPLHDFHGHVLGSVAMSFAKQARGRVSKHTIFFARLDAHLTEAVIKSLSSGTIANLLWSFSKAKVHAAPCVERLRAEVARRGLERCRKEEVVSIAWSLASARVPYDASPLYALVEAQALRWRSRGDDPPVELLGVAFSLAKAGAPSTSPFFASLPAQVLDAGLQRFDDQGLSNITWSLHATGSGTPQVYAAIASEVGKRNWDRFRPSAVATFLLAFSLANVPLSPSALSQVPSHVQRLLSRYKVTELINVAWGLA